MKIIEKCAAQGDEMIYISDFSPLKSGSLDSIKEIQGLDVDYICVAYNPGKVVRTDSAMLAYSIKQHIEKDAIFNLSTRDMNKLALQSHLLGAQMLGLENIVIVKGDDFTERDLSTGVSDVNDFKPTELIEAVAAMNEGKDYKDLKLKSPTDFCIGATIDLGRGIEPEAKLTYSKATAGAHFFLAQPVFDTKDITTFLNAYQAIAGSELSQPVFFGLQILRQDGIIFSSIPEAIRQDLEKGRDGIDIALEQLQQLQDFGIKRVYLIPPILKGGIRDYETAQQLLEMSA